MGHLLQAVVGELFAILCVEGVRFALSALNTQNACGAGGCFALDVTVKREGVF